MMTKTKTFLRWFALLLIVSFVVALVQWIVTPISGATSCGIYLTQIGHPKLGKVLLWLSDTEALRVVNRLGQRVINAPRNRLLHDMQYMHAASPDFYPYEYNTGQWETPREAIRASARDGLLFAFGTVVVYLPLIIGAALVRVSGWNVMKKPVLIAIAVFVAATGIFAMVSNAESSSKSATIFTALSLLTAAVGIMWTPLLTRPRRVTTMVLLLVIVSAIGMVAITRSTGPSDTLSYPIFFGWTLAVLLVEGGAFLLLVGGINRVMSRGRNEPPPSSTMELRTAK